MAGASGLIGRPSSQTKLENEIFSMALLHKKLFDSCYYVEISLVCL